MVRYAKIYIAGGCFWGLEELFRHETGVVDTEVGYMGGQKDNPTYEYHPGHAEVVEVTYDTNTTDYIHLLDFFFRVHDPTTLNQQGNDKGYSYRSAVFYQNESQKADTERVIERVNNSGLWPSPVATSLEKFIHFWPAEEYHQDYLKKHPNGYTCHFVRTQKSFLD